MLLQSMLGLQLYCGAYSERLRYNLRFLKRVKVVHRYVGVASFLAAQVAAQSGLRNAAPTAWALPLGCGASAAVVLAVCGARLLRSSRKCKLIIAADGSEYSQP
eukprot:TRINITY_DN1008_c0_g1_i3.p3 TRINITY_DN1008_c0_g1~~TRINITY_DN1008_c0_g1_i3.p3  ORF type:complete len:104 (+),score=29.37 TRINITY_DN1008_c0_g1_i3:761-1072(+)